MLEAIHEENKIILKLLYVIDLNLSNDDEDEINDIYDQVENKCNSMFYRNK